MPAAHEKLKFKSLNHKSDNDVILVSTVITRERFGKILSNLHMNDNAAFPEDNRDNLYKLCLLIEAMNNIYAKLYNVSRRRSIDESMILFTACHSIKQFNPMKPIKRGNKLWERADMDGYISKFDVSKKSIYC